MNLSNLITAAPEITKTKSPGANVSDGEADSAEAGEFFGLTQDLSNQVPEDQTLLSVPGDIQDVQTLKAENAFLVIEGQGQDPELLGNLPEGATTVAGEVKPDTLNLSAALAPSSDVPLAKPIDAKLSGVETIAALPKTISSEQVQTKINVPSESDAAIQKDKAITVQANSGPGIRAGEPKSPPIDASHPGKLIADGRSLQHAPLAAGPSIPSFVKTGPKPLVREPETPSLARTGTISLTTDSENSTPRVTEVVRATPELSTPASTSTGTTAEPRISQFLHAQGALQPLGSEPPLITGQSATGSLVASTSTNNVVSGALASEISAQAAQRTLLPQIVGSVQTLQNGGVIDLMLDPPELGRIEILIELSDKVLRATLTADRSGTGDLIRRHADDLMQQLSDAGFEDVDLNFADQSDESTEGGIPWTASDQPAEQTSTIDATSNNSIARNGHDRVDLRL